MKINKENAIRLWVERFGNRMTVKDVFGFTMIKTAYNQRGISGAWNIHHIIPKCEGGTDNEVNLKIISLQAHDQIGDRYPSYSVNGESYDVRKIKGTQSYDIITRSKAPPKPQKVKLDNTNKFKKYRQELREAREDHGFDWPWHSDD